MDSQQFDTHHVFVPVTDEIIYDHPEVIEGPLVPYSCGMECHGWLEIEINPEDDLVAASSAKSKLQLAYSAAR